MARNGKSKSRRNKIEPSQLTLTFALGDVEGSQINYIDLSQVCSLVNRRFYRQGLNWAVAGFKVFTQAGFAGTFGIAKLPNTWVMANAWEKSMRVWMKMNNEALEESESVRPRFLDFKVYADDQHHAAGFVGNLLPVSGAGVYVGGEWESAKIFHPTAVGAVEGATIQDEVIAVGASYPGASPVTLLDAVSMIEGYAASRSLPNVLDPNTPHDADDTDNVTPENWMAAIFNEGTEQTSDVLEELTSENNIAPYPFENGNDPNEFLPSGLPNPNWNLPFADTMYPGGANQGTGLEIHDQANITATTIGGITRLKGGNFPCGLIQVGSNNLGLVGGVALQIDLIPGNHRGYLAESMTEM